MGLSISGNVTPRTLHIANAIVAPKLAVLTPAVSRIAGTPRQPESMAQAFAANRVPKSAAQVPINMLLTASGLKPPAKDRSFIDQYVVGSDWEKVRASLRVAAESVNSPGFHYDKESGSLVFADSAEGAQAYLDFMVKFTDLTTDRNEKYTDGAAKFVKKGLSLLTDQFGPKLRAGLEQIEKRAQERNNSPAGKLLNVLRNVDNGMSLLGGLAGIGKYRAPVRKTSSFPGTSRPVLPGNPGTQTMVTAPTKVRQPVVPLTNPQQGLSGKTNRDTTPSAPGKDRATGTGFGTSMLTGKNKTPVTTGVSAGSVTGAKNNIVSFSRMQLPPSGMWPMSPNPGAGSSGGANATVNGGGIAKSPQPDSEIQAASSLNAGFGTVATMSVLPTQVEQSRAKAQVGVTSTTGLQAQATVEPLVLNNETNPKKPPRPGDASPVFAPPSINPITKPKRPGTGDQPGKGNEGAGTAVDREKLATWLSNQGKGVWEQKLAAYRRGSATREETLAGSTGQVRNNLGRVLDQIDRGRVGSSSTGSSGFKSGGGNYSAVEVKEIWRKVVANGGVDKLGEVPLRQLTGITQQGLKNTGLSPAERTDLQVKLASLNQAQQQYQKAREANKNNPPVNTTNWTIPTGELNPTVFFSNTPRSRTDAGSADRTFPLQKSANLANNAIASTPAKQTGLTDSSGMHPYVGEAMLKIPVHRTGTTIIVGAYTPEMLKPGSNRVVNITDKLMSTHEIMNTDWRSKVPDGAEEELHIYRAFTHPLTGKRMALKVDPNKPHTPNSQDQSKLDQLVRQAGVNIKVPVVSFVDEAPSNVLANSLPIVQTQAAMGAVSWAGAKLADVRQAANIDGVSVGSKKEQLARWTLDAVRKYTGVDSDKQTTLPAQWMLHFFAGSGQPKVLDQDQMKLLHKAFYRDHPDSFVLSDALDSKIKYEKSKGRTQGSMEIYIPHDVGIEAVHAPIKDGLHNTLGGYHPGTVFKIDWKLMPNNDVKVTGTKTFIAQDRYNWEAAEFNGQSGTKPIPKIPREVLETVLPAPMLDSFSNGVAGHRLATAKEILLRSPAQSSFYSVTDGAFGHLQMGTGGAQAFTTIGVTGGLKVDATWKLKRN